MQTIEVLYRQRPRPWGLTAQPVITSAIDAVRLLTPVLDRQIVEVCIVLCLDAKLWLIGMHELSRGSLTSTLVEPRNVMQVALLANAAAIVLVHNHPSGDPTPSPEDRAAYERIKAVGELMNVPVHDFIIIGAENRYTSMHEGR